MLKPLIKLENISKKYGHVVAIKKVDLEIEEGSFLTIFGANGAGKSTLLKILSHQTKASGGNILYSDVPINKLSDDFRAKFGVISHLPFVYENLTALENLEFYGKLYNVKNVKNRAIELLKKVDLVTRMNDPVRTFSRGMLQRVSIARALIHDPEIIFLDEPYTGLDNVARNSLTELLKEQLSSSKTIIMITHDLPIGLSLASKVVIMKKGEMPYCKIRSEIDEATFEKEYLKHAGTLEVAL